MSGQRTKAQRHWRRKGLTHETGYWSGRGRPWHFLLALGPESAAYFRRHPAQPGDEFVRPICQQFIHNGRKP